MKCSGKATGGFLYTESENHQSYGRVREKDNKLGNLRWGLFKYPKRGAPGKNPTGGTGRDVAERIWSRLRSYGQGWGGGDGGGKRKTKGARGEISKFGGDQTKQGHYRA